MAQSLPIPFLWKAAQTEPLQANHQFTPDAIGFIITFLIDQLAKATNWMILEVGSGTGNLAETIVNNSRLTIDYLGLEVDDLLIDLSASIADVMESSVVFAQRRRGASSSFKRKWLDR